MAYFTKLLVKQMMFHFTKIQAPETHKSHHHVGQILFFCSGGLR
jgi:hypothetical protein